VLDRIRENIVGSGHHVYLVLGGAATPRLYDWIIINYRDQSRNQTFTYDALNRLTSAQNTGTDCTKTLPDGHIEYWGNSYNYDAWTSCPLRSSAPLLYKHLAV
jgi:YD repeat-containing protein